MNSFRLSGIAIVAGGVFLIVINAVFTPMLATDVPFPELMASNTYLWRLSLAALTAFLFMIGCFTRLTSILTFLITVSYAHRAVGALFGLDQVNGLLALYLAVGPSGQKGAHWSIHIAWSLYKPHVCPTISIKRHQAE